MTKNSDYGAAEGGTDRGDKLAGLVEAQAAGPEPASVKTLPAMVRDLLKKVEAKIGEGDLKALGDYLKLMQMLKELEEEEPREIKVQWLETIRESGE